MPASALTDPKGAPPLPGLSTASVVSPPPRKRTLALLLVRVRHVALRRKKTLLACLAVSAALAWVVAGHFATYTWEAKGTMLSTPLPVPESQKTAYSAPNLKTYLTMVKSEKTLQTLCDEFDLPVPTKLIDSQLKIELQTNTEVIAVSFRWGEKGKAVAMTDRLMELFIQKSATIRRQRLKDNLDDLKGDLAAADRRLQESSKAMQEFKVRVRLSDPRNALDRLNTESAALEAAQVTNRQTANSLRAQLAALNTHIQKLKTEDKAEQETSSEASEESLGDNRRRQDRLRELIADKQKMQEVRPALEVKQKEYQRAVTLQKRGAASSATVERLRAEVAGLAARVTESQKVKEWRQELDRIDQMVVPKGKQKKAGSIIVVQMLSRKLELELQMVGLEEERVQIASNLEQKRLQHGNVLVTQQQAEALLKEIEAAELHRQKIESQRASIQQLLGPNSHEFIVVEKAGTGPHPASSTTKFILAGVLVGGMFLSLAGLVGHDLARGTTSAEELALFAGLPVLSMLDDSHEAGGAGGPVPGEDVDDIRGLALRLRQHVPGSGVTVLLTGVSADSGLGTTAAWLAYFLARRDERVAILDARLSPARSTDPFPWPTAGETGSAVAGLTDYLTFACDRPGEILRPTSIPGVDHIGTGLADAPSDLLATRRMKELIEFLRGRYTMVIVLGPAVAERVDLEILAAQANGIVLLLQAARHREAALRRFLDSMRELKAPLLGSVVCS